MRRPGEPAPAPAPRPRRRPRADPRRRRRPRGCFGSGFNHVPAPVPGVERSSWPPSRAGEPAEDTLPRPQRARAAPRLLRRPRGGHRLQLRLRAGSHPCGGAPAYLCPPRLGPRDRSPERRERAEGARPRLRRPRASGHRPRMRRAPGTLVPICGEGAPKNSDPGGDRAPITSSVPVGGDLDRLSILPDDILLLVLVRLRIDEVVRTSVLAPRWRSLWTQLRTLVFREEPTAQARRFQDLVQGALAPHAGGALDRLCIELVKRPETDFAHVATWLHAAAARVMQLFCLQVTHCPERLETNFSNPMMVLEVPCFQSATQLILCPLFVEVRLPVQSFSRLRRFVLVGARFTEAGADPLFVISSCCPKLEVLEIANLFGVSDLRINCEMLLELRVGWIDDISVLEIVAPRLQNMLIIECSSSHGSRVSITAPDLKIIDWRNSCFCENIGSSRLDKFRFSLRDIELAMPLLESFLYIRCIDIVVYDAMRQELIKKEIDMYSLPDHAQLKISFEPNGPEFNVKINVLDDQESDSKDQEDKERPTG